jgi:iron(III) transport system permease protein
MMSQPAKGPDMARKRLFDVWAIVYLAIFAAYLLFLIYPMYTILQNSVIGENGKLSLEWFTKFFSQKYYSDTLIHSFNVTLCTTILSLVIGVPLAYFYNLYEIKGRSLIQVLIILCSMSAPFIGAYAWIQLLGRSGIVTKFIQSSFGITIPNIYGFNGILLVLTLQLYPLVFLYVSGALRNIDNSLLEASDNLGCTGIRRFFKVIIPLCMPTILAAALLVFMRAFADFGTPLLIGEGYRVFPVEIYTQFLGETGTNYNFAAAISVIAIIITAFIFLFQKILSSKFAFTMNALNPIERRKTKGIQGFFIYLYTYVIIGLAFLPQVYIVYQSFQNTSGKLFKPGYSFDSYKTALKRMGDSIPNTFIIGGIALVAVVFLAILISYFVVRRSNVITQAIDTMSMLPYIIPGSVVGIALVMAFNKKPIILTGTVGIMVIALCIRRLPYTIRSSVATLQQIPLTTEEAAISLGASKMKTFFKITVPMMSNGIISGAILSWVTIITELSTAIILYNSKTVTLTLAVYTFVTRGNFGYAAALATVLTALTVVSLLIFMKVSKSKEIAF